MSEKKYTVVCNGTTVEVTKEVYNAYNSELRYEDRHRRTKTVSRIEIDLEKEKNCTILMKNTRIALRVFQSMRLMAKDILLQAIS